MRISISRKFQFAAAHSLPTHKGKCKGLHGHSYVTEVEIMGPVCDNPVASHYGMIMDFGDLKKEVEAVIDLVDHKHLNNLDIVCVPTAEKLAWWLAVEIGKRLGPYPDIELVELRLWEEADKTFVRVLL